MHILTVVSHPREDSLTMDVTKRFIEGAKEAGHTVELLDLYREEFQPVLFEKDEPDWERTDLHYSPVVLQEIERMKRADGLAFIFPVWWYSIPAMLKGYIDRVWNYNFAYGSERLPHERIQWIGLVGASEQQFEKRQYDRLIRYYLNIGLSQFVGVSTSRATLLYDTLSGGTEDERNAWYESVLERAYIIGKEYGTFTSEQPLMDRL